MSEKTLREKINDTLSLLRELGVSIAELEQRISAGGSTDSSLSEVQHILKLLRYLDIERKLPDCLDDMDECAFMIREGWDEASTNIDQLHMGDNELTYFPMVNTTNVISAVETFKDSGLCKMAPVDFRALENARQMFSGCTLSEWPAIDLSGVSDAAGVFEGVKGIDHIPDVNLSSWNQHSYYWLGPFKDCRARTIGDVDVSSATNIWNFCYQCCDLTRVGHISVSTDKAWSAHQWFDRCYKLEKVPDIDFSMCRDMNMAFYQCNSLTVIPPLETGNVTNWYCAFAAWEGKVERIEGVDISNPNAKDIHNMIVAPKAKYIVLKGLGSQRSQTTIDLSQTDWGADSQENMESIVRSLIELSKDRAAAGWPAMTVELGDTIAARLTDEQKAAITAKGFSIA